MKSLNPAPLYVLLAIIIGITACGDRDQADPQMYSQGENLTDANIADHDAFFQNLSALCGETLSGQASYPDTPEHPLVATELRTHLSECDDRMVRIELYRDSNYWHGAWVLEKRDEGLHLYHDHLGDERTYDDLGEDDAHGYGGYADGRGSATRQYFPADDVTADMLPEASTNVWMMELDLENDQFVYYLERHNEVRFQAELDRE